MVGYLKDLEDYWDSPMEEEVPKYVASTEAIKSVIEGSLRAQNLASSMEKPTPYAGA
jgi:DNA polymerase II large subunit